MAIGFGGLSKKQHADSNHGVIGAGRGLDGLEILEDNDIDLILPDLMMPGRNSPQFPGERLIRELDKPVIITSGCLDSEAVMEVMTHGPVKPLPGFLTGEML